MKVLCVIPARYASTRLPGKPLKLIAGKTMIERVYRAAKKAKRPGAVIVATDDNRIYDAVKKFGGDVMMTRADHQSGTDRLAEVAEQFPDIDVIVNVQGDEPMLPAEIIDRLADAFNEDTDLAMATMKVKMRENEYDDPSAVKVVTDLNGYAIYFSRSLIPYPRKDDGTLKIFKHVGVYAYRRDFLLRYAKMERSPLEKAESLEQLRALENGYRIKVLESDFQGVGVDTQEDLEAVNKIFAEAEHAHD